MSSSLSHSPAEVIAQLLREAGYTSVYTKGEPSSPDSVITVKDTAGTDDGRTMVDGELQQHYGVQVRVRSPEHPAGWLVTNNIRVLFSEGVNQQVVTMGDGTRFLVWAVTNIGQILPIGKDTPRTKRDLFTLNATVPMREITNG
jgi:hypothetical protein